MTHFYIKFETLIENVLICNIQNMISSYLCSAKNKSISLYVCSATLQIKSYASGGHPDAD